MISGQSHRLASGLLLAAAALVVSASGCSSSLDSSRYPTTLRYQARQDLLIKTPPTQTVTMTYAPGKLDESIRKVSEAKSVVKFDPRDLTKEDSAEIQSALVDVFGTPANPSVEPLGPTDLPKSATDKRREEVTANDTLYRGFAGAAFQDADLTPADIDLVKVERADLRKGSVHYRRHCMHCHGLNGDGRGPTGPWVSPHPRDYRQGAFKFVSTSGGNRKPRREDLRRTIAKGIEGTSMPAFGLLEDRDIDEIASYVTHLSIRGQVEYDTISTLLGSMKDGKVDKGVLDDGSIKSHVYKRAAVVLTLWIASNKRKPLEPPPYPYEGAEPKALEAAVRNGYQIFVGDKGGCVKCHLDFGRQVPYNYDDWGTLVQPRNLTEDTYRGGRRPLDIYWRIAGGIEPSGMKATNLDAKDYWDLIHFVRAMPYPRMLPEDVRKKVYGETKPEKASTSHASR